MMFLRSDEVLKLGSLMGQARQGTLGLEQEQKLRYVLSWHDSRALTMSRADLFHLGFMLLGMQRMLNVIEGRAVIIDV